MPVFSFNEHERLSDDKISRFNELSSKFNSKLPLSVPNVDSVKEVSYLGVFSECGCPKSHYYIGASWFVENEIAFVVNPKVDVDYIKLFMTALDFNSPAEAEYFSDYYDINFNQPAINAESLDNVISPLLVLHYISLLKHLVAKGLKKGYVVREENLRSKVRGRILLQRHLIKNVFTKREDRTFCKFHEFTEDIPENRLLKKALIFSVRYINQFAGLKKYIDDLSPQLSLLNRTFERISMDVTMAQVAKVKSDKIFRHYENAIKVAKLILRHFDYSMEKVDGKEHPVCPFCIDMPRLYEMYVLNLLRKTYPGQILFQVKGRHGTQVDYLKISPDEKLILDAKYKPRYDSGDVGIIADIREMSGYSRDENILDALDWHIEGNNSSVIAGDFLPKCVIIYPDPKTKFIDESDLEDRDCEVVQNFDSSGILNDNRIKVIPGFKGFYKIAVPLPYK